MRIRLPHEISTSIVAFATVFLGMSPLNMPTWAIFITWAGTFLLGGPTRDNAVKLISATTAGAGFGVVAILLNRATGSMFGDSAFGSTLALGVVIFVVSWQFIPFHALIYQGGVMQIPKSMFEAAEIDGAGTVRQFFSITLPQLKYTIITSSTLMVVGSLTFFDLIFVLTAGGPGDATRVLALDMYKRGFQANLMGPASAIAVILVLVGLGLALLLRRVGGSTTDSQLEGV